MLVISLEGDNGQTLLPFPPVVTDGAGNFAMQVLIPQDYAGQSQVVMLATDNTSKITVRTPYNIERSAAPTPTSVPTTAPIAPSPTTPLRPSPTSPAAATATRAPAQISVTPNPIIIGKAALVSGAGFPASEDVDIYVVAGSNPNATPTGTPITTLPASATGTFTAQITLTSSPQNATTVTVIAMGRGTSGVSATAVVDVAVPQINPLPGPGAGQAYRKE